MACTRIQDTGQRHQKATTFHPAPPAMIRGHLHHGYGGSTLPEDVILPQFYDITALRRSHVRMNDELVPKPTEVNLSERQIKVPVPREHPYHSHISLYTMFPSFCCPDDPESGLRARMKKPLGIGHIIVLSKGKGGKPFHHEAMDRTTQTKEQAVIWPGQHGFYQCGSENREPFYPSPPKTVLPNPTLRDRDLTLSHCAANILHNLKRMHMLTCYQLHYTGNGPANPVQLDDLHERITEAALKESSPYLRVHSHPVLVPARPKHGRKARLLQGRRPLESKYHPDSHIPGNLPHPDSKPGNAIPCDKFHRNGDNESIMHSELFSGVAGPHGVHFRPDWPGEDKMPGQTKKANQPAQLCDACGSEEGTCECQNQRTDPSHPPGPTPYEHKPTPRGKSHNLGDETQPESLGGVEVQLGDYGDGETQPRFPYIHSQPGCMEGRQTGGGLVVPGYRGSQSALLGLQDSFNMSDAHKRLQDTVKGGVPDLRDSRQTGRKHSFYGVNPLEYH